MDMVKEQAPQFRRTLTLLPLVILGLAYMAPMTVFSTYGVAAQTTQGMIPAAYLIALTAMLFTACSYGKMVKAYPLAGSAYTYTQKTISPHLGFMVGWAVLMDYLFLPMINFLLSGIFLSAAFPDVPSWVWILLFIGVITAINILGIRMTARINGVLVLFQFVVTIVFLVLAMKGITNGMGLGTGVHSVPVVSRIRCGDDPFRGDGESKANRPKGYFSGCIYRRLIVYLRFLHCPAGVSRFSIVQSS
jgi:putrescine importer